MGFLGFFCVSSSVWMVVVSGEVLEEMETGVVEAEEGVEMQMLASPPTKTVERKTVGTRKTVLAKRMKPLDLGFGRFKLENGR